MKKLIAIGDNCIDAYHKDNNFFSGGNAVNVSVYTKRFNSYSAYLGWVGSDLFGKKIIEDLNKKEVNTSHVHIKSGNTAITEVTLDGNERVMGDYHEGVMANFNITEDDISFISEHDIIHAGIWGHCEKYINTFYNKGLITSFDFSDCWDSPLLKTLIPFVNYAFLSAKKDTIELRKKMQEMRNIGGNIIIVTLGDKGSILYDGNDFMKYPIINTNVIDTMGAGDSYIAGFLHGVINNKSLMQCMELGAKNASITIQYHGAW